MIIKHPPVYDVSHWKSIPDFKLINPKPFLMITKATEGTSIIDSKFIRFFDGMQTIGCLRGAYHFNRKALSPLDQADFFCNYIKLHIDRETLLILDVEEGGESAAALQTWFNAVRSAYPFNRLLLYSRRDILEQMVMTAAQKEFFKPISIWTAGYPTDPDRYDYVPSVYMPDPSRFGSVVLWQYSAHGAVDGIIGDVDLNWISPAYYQILGGTDAPPQPPTGDTMKKGTVKSGYTLTVRDSTGKDTGKRLLAGDVVVGDVLNNRIYFTSVMRANESVEQITGNSATVSPVNPGEAYMTLEDFVPPVADFPPRIGITYNGMDVRWYVPE